MFKISSNSDIKACRSLKRRAILKIPTIVFQETRALSVGFIMKPLRKKGFSGENKNQLKFCRKTC